MKQNDISILPRLTEENLENIFNIYQDETGRFFYKLLNTIQFPEDLPSIYFNNYTIGFGDTWPLVSYKAYKSTKLWWVITKANKIISPINTCIPGTEIKIPTIEVVREIITQITTTRD
jgi:nucleoid-associated protein YgaU